MQIFHQAKARGLKLHVSVRRETNSTKLGLALLPLALLPMAFLSLNGVIDPYTHNWVASAIETVKEGRLPEAVSYAPGAASLLAVVSLTAGFDVTALEYALLNGPILLLAVWSLTKMLTGSGTAAGLVTVTVSFAFGASYYSVWPHGFGFTLFSLFVYFLFRLTIFATRTDSAQRLLICMVLLFFGIHFYSYTAELWSLALLLFTALAVSIYNWQTRKKQTNLSSFFFAALAAAFTFNNLVYQAFIPKLSASDFLGSLGQIATQILSISISPSANADGLLLIQPTPAALKLLTLSFLILVAAPLILDLNRIVRGWNREPWVLPGLLRLAIAAVLIADIVGYGFVGAIFFRYANFLFPVLAASGLMLRWRKVGKVYLAFIAAISITIFVWNWNLDYATKSRSAFAEVVPVAEWYYSKRTLIRPLIGDHHTLGQFDLVAAQRGLRQPAHFYSADVYKRVFLPGTDVPVPGLAKLDFAINRAIADKRTWAGGWEDFPPIGPHLSYVQNNPSLGMLYDNGRVLFLRGRSSR